MIKCIRCETDKEISEFGKKIGDKLQPYCKDCQREYQKEWYSKNKEKKIKQSGVNRKLHRDWFNDYKSSLSCEECGENHIATLDFHHSDPSQKEFTIAKFINRYGKQRLLDEISKCQVLCSNCHRKLHYNLKNNAGMV